MELVKLQHVSWHQAFYSVVVDSNLSVFVRIQYSIHTVVAVAYASIIVFCNAICFYCSEVFQLVIISSSSSFSTIQLKKSFSVNFK